MSLLIETVPCLSDNYAFLAHDPATNETAVVDVPEAKPILARLAEKGWVASKVIITHHHADHVQGLTELLQQHSAQVIGSAADADRLPPLDIRVSEGDTVKIGTFEGHVLDVSGHTLNHLAFHFPLGNVVFTADSLMALGCGRVFEGTMEQMWGSLSKIAALPPETLVCSGHEYTAANGQFAITIDPENKDLLARVASIKEDRAANRPTVPSRLSLELATNPFLRPTDPSIQGHLGMVGAHPAEVFAEIRRRKDAF
ncbi:MAG: hydroxyacylglutathione hydrolase [Pseudomonadota bacterium]